MSEIIAYNPPVQWVREQIGKAGNTLGGVHFLKRTDGALRKMSYRLHVKAPSVAKAPAGETSKVYEGVNTSGTITDGSAPQVLHFKRKEIDLANSQMTVLDANKVVRDGDGAVKGRGAWRTIPLENVVRITNRGNVYTIHRSYN